MTIIFSQKDMINTFLKNKYSYFTIEGLMKETNVDDKRKIEKNIWRLSKFNWVERVHFSGRTQKRALYRLREDLYLKLKVE